MKLNLLKLELHNQVKLEIVVNKTKRMAALKAQERQLKEFDEAATV